MADRDRNVTQGMQGDLTDGGHRRDYGPAGCAGIVLAPVVLVAMALLRGGRR